MKTITTMIVAALLGTLLGWMLLICYRVVFYNSITGKSVPTIKGCAPSAMLTPLAGYVMVGDVRRRREAA